MRLEEFDTKYPIVYTPGDVESMRDALGKYTDLVISGEAFEDDYCVAHFVHSCDKLPLSYFKKHPELMKIIRSEHYYSSSMREEEMEDVQSMMTGETLFFICAMMHPELELDVKKACEGIVKYARSKNDSSRMWLTCEYPFGIEPLYITARTYPKYGYLLASFLVPYWDDEHMPEALFELASWTSKVGITEDSIKAFCYCDNSRARENVLGYDTWDGGGEEPVESDFDLVTYFRENNDAYEAFIDQLADRYEETPFLQTYEDDEREYIEKPIVSLVLDMLYVHHPYDVWDDDFDRDEYFLNHFVKGSAEQDIDYIKRRIEEKLKRPIVKPIEEFRRETAQRN
jgi:hypothetical protein